MAALIPGVSVMSDRLQALGYAEVTTRAESMLGPAGTSFRGHQFRYSTMQRGSRENEIEQLYDVKPRWGGVALVEGYRRGNVLASYVHAHWASNPKVAENLVRACANNRRGA